jgi:hypothetical protein
VYHGGGEVVGKGEFREFGATVNGWVGIEGALKN